MGKINRVLSKKLLPPLFIFLLTFFIYSFKLPQHLFFGHEQGRDAFTARGIYTGRDFTLIGSRTEIAGFHTGPWYFYLLAIPYGLTKGDPVAATLFIAAITSLTSVVMYFFTKDVLDSKKWGVVAALITAFSFELITYSRWLINVSVAYPAIAMSIYMLWKYHSQKRQRFFILFAFFALLAMQVQVTLLFQYIFVFLVLLIFKVISFPKWKTVILIFLIALLLFLPLIIFDLRNDFLNLKSVLGYLQGKSNQSFHLNMLQAFVKHTIELLAVVKRSLFTIKNPILETIFFIILFIGTVYSLQNQKLKKAAIFILAYCVMSFGIIPFNIQLTQLFQGTAIGLIALVIIVLYNTRRSKRLKPLSIFLGVLLLVSSINNVNNIAKNEGFFFKTGQDDINITDQKKLLAFIHEDAEVKPYRIESFTVPYLHSEGWQYLQEYLYPHEESKAARIVYVIIQKNVEKFWEDKWLEDIGKTEQIYETTFGQIRLQKRLIVSPVQ